MDIDPMLPNGTSCFLVDVDPIFKSSKKYWKDLQHLSAPVFSDIVKFTYFVFVEMSTNNNKISPRMFCIFLVFFIVSWCPQNYI